ncbi:MAG: EscU/YscU/HrcU family type III secretion system export apparatus switch protein [Planctomycetes bacterium]|nr:EscU/YscU/HrcU family type III secretion system export apparatus switch protein [Planctomycetota bacterium]
MKGTELSQTVAVALGYDPERDRAPRIRATGRGRLAEEILRFARESGVPIEEDADLAAALGALDVGAEIPPELYRVVAEILAYLWRTARRIR